MTSDFGLNGRTQTGRIALDRRPTRQGPLLQAFTSGPYRNQTCDLGIDDRLSPFQFMPVPAV